MKIYVSELKAGQRIRFYTKGGVYLIERIIPDHYNQDIIKLIVKDIKTQESQSYLTKRSRLIEVVSKVRETWWT